MLAKFLRTPVNTPKSYAGITTALTAEVGIGAAHQRDVVAYGEWQRRGERS